jgi:hypothetical protein
MNDVEPLAPVESVTVTITLYEPVFNGVPEMTPEEGSIDSPEGRPVAV